MIEQNLPPAPSDDPDQNPDIPTPDEPTGPTVPEPTPTPLDQPNPYPVTDPLPGDDQPTDPEKIPPRIF